MKTVIGFLFSICLLVSNLAVAKESGENIENFKQKITQHVDAEIVILTQFKTCIQAAQTQADFKSCQETKKQAQKQLMTEMKKARLERRKQRLADQEKQMNEAAKLEKK
jgi:hypothetical protein